MIQNLRVPIVGADIVEFNPRRDPVGITAMAAAKFLKEIAGRMLELNSVDHDLRLKADHRLRRALGVSSVERSVEPSAFRPLDCDPAGAWIVIQREPGL